MRVTTLQCMLCILIFCNTVLSYSVPLERALPRTDNIPDTKIDYGRVSLSMLDSICISNCYYLFYPAVDSGNTVACYSFICGDSVLFSEKGLAVVVKIETIIENLMLYNYHIDSVLSSAKPLQQNVDAYMYNDSGTSWITMSTELCELSELIMQNDRDIIEQIEQCIGNELRTLGSVSFDLLHQYFLSSDCGPCIENVHSKIINVQWYAIKCSVIDVIEEE